ncbi:MAG: hypothetical protein Q4E72_05065 [bacterium]|nr:hypothetical protein [bacterium]
MYNSIKPGRVWLDTNDKPIQAMDFPCFGTNKMLCGIGMEKTKKKRKGAEPSGIGV